MKRFFYVLFLLFISLFTFSQATFTPNFAIPSPLCSGIALTTTCAVTPGTTAIVGYTWTSTPAGPVIGAPNASVTSINFGTAGTCDQGKIPSLHCFLLMWVVFFRGDPPWFHFKSWCNCLLVLSGAALVAERHDVAIADGAVGWIVNAGV